MSNQLYKDIFLKIVIFANCYLFFGFVFSSVIFGIFFFIKYYYLCFATIKTNEWFNEKLNLKAPKFNGYISKLIVSIYKKKNFSRTRGQSVPCNPANSHPTPTYYSTSPGARCISGRCVCGLAAPRFSRRFSPPPRGDGPLGVDAAQAGVRHPRRCGRAARGHA